MGILYAAAIEQKRQFLIEELQKLNVTQSQSGIDLRDLSYDELKYELVLASFRQIDSEVDANRWF